MAALSFGTKDFARAYTVAPKAPGENCKAFRGQGFRRLTGENSQAPEALLAGLFAGFSPQQVEAAGHIGGKVALE